MEVFQTTHEAMATTQGQRLYQIIANNFERFWKLSPKVKQFADRTPCVIGSQTHIERLVQEILNEVTRAK